MEVNSTREAIWAPMAAPAARLEHFYLAPAALGVRPHPPSAIHSHCLPSRRSRGQTEPSHTYFTVFTGVRMLEVVVTNTPPGTIHPVSASVPAVALTE